MVLETQSVQQGLECVFDFSSKLTALENITILENVRKEVNSFSIFESSRTTKINGEKIVKGQPIGMKDGNLIHRGESPEMVLCKILKDISLPNYERIIVIIGNPIPASQVTNIVAKINLEFSLLEDRLEVIYGGQPHYDYLISAISSSNR